MGQYLVKLFQQARINTENFTVEADNEEAARQSVISEHLSDKEDAKTDGQFDLETELVAPPEPVTEAPQTAEKPPVQPIMGVHQGVPTTAEQPQGNVVNDTPPAPAAE